MLDKKFVKDLLNLKQNEKQFDFFDIIPPKEVLISKWVEFILNPKVNGIGNNPLQSLIDLTNSCYDLCDYEFESSETEVPTDNRKRIDILLKYKGVWIAIENKIGSLENDEQTNEYFKYIEKTKGENEVVYIYLKPNYNKSLPINKNFIVVTYDDFINKLKKINKSDYNDPSKFKYLNEFLISGGRFMRNEEIEITENIKFYAKEFDKITALLDEYNEQNNKLLNKITNDIEEYMNKNFSGYKTYKSGNYIQIFKDVWNNEKHVGVHYEISFKSNKIIGRKMNADVVLHIEHSVSEEQLNEFKHKGITKHGKKVFKDDKEIKTELNLNFTSSDDIIKSIKLINDELNKLAQKYERSIDTIMKA